MCAVNIHNNGIDIYIESRVSERIQVINNNEASIRSVFLCLNSVYSKREGYWGIVLIDPVLLMEGINWKRQLGAAPEWLEVNDHNDVEFLERLHAQAFLIESEELLLKIGMGMPVPCYRAVFRESYNLAMTAMVRAFFPVGAGGASRLIEETLARHIREHLVE